jgi:hypothetical protein
MDLNKCLDQATKQAEKAIQEDQVEIDGQVYNLKFNPNEWIYKVTDADGDFVVSFNTKKITQAKKWLKEYFQN